MEKARKYPLIMGKGQSRAVAIISDSMQIHFENRICATIVNGEVKRIIHDADFCTFWHEVELATI